MKAVKQRGNIAPWSVLCTHGSRLVSASSGRYQDLVRLGVSRSAPFDASPWTPDSPARVSETHSVHRFGCCRFPQVPWVFYGFSLTLQLSSGPAFEFDCLLCLLVLQPCTSHQSLLWFSLFAPSRCCLLKFASLFTAGILVNNRVRRTL